MVFPGSHRRSETSDGKTLNGKSYPHPPPVFVVDGEHRLSVRALPVTLLILFDVCEPLFQATLAVGDAPPRIFQG